MTGAELMAVVTFFITICGVLFVAWWRIENRINATKKEALHVANKTRDDFVAYQLHVAEHYVTKVSMQEQTRQVMGAIQTVGTRIDSLIERVDRFYENKK